MSHGPDELVERVRRGDRQALGELILARRPQLLNFIERNLSGALRRKVEPDDILQDTSADAVRSLPGVDLTERDPFGWLCQIAERRIIDAHRRFFGSQKRNAAREVALDAAGSEPRRGGLIDMLVASMTSASKAFSRNQREMRLHEALAELSEEQRTALHLRYVEGLPSKEIAERLGKTDGSVRVLLTRSLRRLQALLGPEAAP